MVSFTHEQNIVCTKLENIAHEQTMICRQLFAGHLVGSQPMKRKKNLQRMITIIILLCCSLPVPLSLADTLTIPLASISNVTSTCGTPRGAGGIPTCNEPCQKHRKGRVIFYYCTLWRIFHNLNDNIDRFTHIKVSFDRLGVCSTG